MKIETYMQKHDYVPTTTTTTILLSLPYYAHLFTFLLKAA